LKASSTTKDTLLFRLVLQLKKPVKSQIELDLLAEEEYFEILRFALPKENQLLDDMIQINSSQRWVLKHREMYLARVIDLDSNYHLNYELKHQQKLLNKENQKHLKD
jgi:hypothetical protein